MGSLQQMGLATIMPLAVDVKTMVPTTTCKSVNSADDDGSHERKPVHRCTAGCFGTDLPIRILLLRFLREWPAGTISEIPMCTK